MGKGNIPKSYSRLAIGALLWLLPITDGFNTAIADAERGLVAEIFGKWSQKVYAMLVWISQNNPYVLFGICSALVVVSVGMMAWGIFGIVKDGLNKIKSRNNKVRPSEEQSLNGNDEAGGQEDNKRLHAKVEGLYEENRELNKKLIEFYGKENSDADKR